MKLWVFFVIIVVSALNIRFIKCVLTPNKTFNSVTSLVECYNVGGSSILQHKSLTKQKQLKPRTNGRHKLANNSQGVVASVCTYLISFTGLKLCATTPNNIQQGVQTAATCNIQQCCARLHVALYHKTQTGERL